MNSLPLSQNSTFGTPRCSFSLLNTRNYILSFQALADFDGQAFPCVNIHDGQRTEASPITELIGDEVQRPNLVGTTRTEALLPMHNRAPPSWWTLAQSQPFFLRSFSHQRVSLRSAYQLGQRTDCQHGKNTEQIELLELDAAGIHVAEYLTVLPPPEVSRAKLHEAVEVARTRIRSQEEENISELSAKDRS